MKKNSSEQRGTRNRQHPSEYDSTGHSPTHRSQAPRRPDADNGPSYRVSRAYRNTEMRSSHQRQSTGCFSGKSPKRCELRDALTHSPDDSPTARHRTAAHRQVAANNHPIGNIVRLHQTTGDERRRDNAHSFLRVIRPVTKAITRSGQKL